MPIPVCEDLSITNVDDSQYDLYGSMLFDVAISPETWAGTFTTQIDQYIDDTEALSISIYTTDSYGTIISNIMDCDNSVTCSVDLDTSYPKNLLVSVSGLLPKDTINFFTDDNED